MSISLFVGNISWESTEAQIRNLFEGFGQVDGVKLISDRETGKPRGFGFVTAPHAEEAQRMIKELHGYEFMGRTLNVNEARPMEQRPRGNGGGGGYRDSGPEPRHDRGRESRGNREHRY